MQYLNHNVPQEHGCGYSMNLNSGSVQSGNCISKNTTKIKCYWINSPAYTLNMTYSYNIPGNLLFSLNIQWITFMKKT